MWLFALVVPVRSLFAPVVAAMLINAFCRYVILAEDTHALVPAASLPFVVSLPRQLGKHPAILISLRQLLLIHA